MAIGVWRLHVQTQKNHLALRAECQVADGYGVAFCAALAAPVRYFTYFQAPFLIWIATTARLS